MSFVIFLTLIMLTKLVAQTQLARATWRSHISLWHRLFTPMVMACSGFTKLLTQNTKNLQAEATATSLKKAKKKAQGIGEKKKKEEEQAKKQTEDKEKCKNLLQKSQTIVVEEDRKLLTASRVSNCTLFAWYF